MVTTARRRSRRGEGERLRSEIVAAAQRLLAERGSEDAVSVRAIAEAIGVTPPSIYLHFPDKESLFVAVCDERFEALDRRSEEAAAAAVDPLDEIRLRGEAYVRFGLENPEQYRILFMRPQDAASPERIEKRACLQHMVDAVQRGMDAGSVVGSDPFAVTLQLWALVHGLVSLLISMPEFPWPPVPTLVAGAVDMCAFGFVPRAARRRGAAEPSRAARRARSRAGSR